MDRLNPLDAEFLYLENATTHMHVASCSVFEGPAPAYDSVVARFASKLPLVPRYRQRVRFVPLDIGRPVWADDPHFDVVYHVRHTALPPPGDQADLCRLMGRLMSQPLDRARPLWEAWMVEGLAGGRWALVSKIHHSMIDGIAGVDLISVVLDHERAPAPAVEDDWEPAAEPSGLRLAVDGARSLVTSPSQAARAAWAAMRAPRWALGRGVTIATGLLGYGSALRPTPPTSLDGTIGRHRRWTSTGTTLADIRTIRHALGGTVNDVVLAAITSGFRDLILARGEDPAHVALRTLVPISVRDETGRGVYDNRVSAIFLALPVHLADPLERMAAVHEEMDHLKQSHETEAGVALTTLVGAVPPTVTAQATRLASRLASRVTQRTMNTVTTNVPGPQFPLYLAGQEMLEYLPFVPIGGGVRIGVAILSYNGQVRFGVTGDYDTAPDIGVLADGIDAAVATLLRLSGAGAAEPAAAQLGSDHQECDGAAPASRGGSSRARGGPRSSSSARSAAKVSTKSP
jgi:diacylglycerol O-acyltransferase